VLVLVSVVLAMLSVVLLISRKHRANMKDTG